MDWQTIKAALKTWASEESGLTAVWDNEPLAWVAKQRIHLSTSASRGVGVDEERLSDPDSDLPPAADMIPTIAGQRTFTLTVRVESRDQTAGNNAEEYLERLRVSTQKRSAQAKVRAAGLSFADVLGVQIFDHVVQGRMESVAQLDFRMNAASNTTIADNAVGYFDKVRVSTSLLPSVGVDLVDEEFGDV